MSCSGLLQSWSIRFHQILNNGRIPAQTYGRSYSASRLRTLSCEGCDPMSRGRPRRGERVGAETIDQSPDDGEAGIANALHRAAGDGPAWAAHPCPDHRPRSPAASGVPVRGCAGAAGGGRGRRLSGSWNRLPAPLHFHVPVSPFCSCRCPITPANRYVPVSPLRICHCPMTVEGAPESGCSPRCGRMPRSPRFQLRNRPGCNLPPRAISCTRVTHPERLCDSRAP